MKTIRIEEIHLNLDDKEDILKNKIAKILNLHEKEIVTYSIVKKTIDSRKKPILFVYSIDVQVNDIKKVKKWNPKHRTRIHEPFVYQEKVVKNPKNKNIVVVGSGPCGLFTTLSLAKAGLNRYL